MPSWHPALLLRSFPSTMKSKQSETEAKVMVREKSDGTQPEPIPLVCLGVRASGYVQAILCATVSSERQHHGRHAGPQLCHPSVLEHSDKPCDIRPTIVCRNWSSLW